MRYERYFTIAIFALLWTGVLDIPLDFLSGKILTFVSTLADLPFNFI
jgi:hypothetical protein